MNAVGLYYNPAGQDQAENAVPLPNKLVKKEGGNKGRRKESILTYIHKEDKEERKRRSFPYCTWNTIN